MQEFISQYVQCGHASAKLAIEENTPIGSQRDAGPISFPTFTETILSGSTGEKMRDVLYDSHENYSAKESGRDTDPRAILNPFKEKTWQNGRRIKEPNEPMFCITVSDRHGIVHHGRIRRLMPIEAWRLQGFTDEQADVITIAILGSICGSKNVNQIHQWAASDRVSEFLKEKFGINHVPCYSLHIVSAQVCELGLTKSSEKEQEKAKKK